MRKIFLCLLISVCALSVKAQVDNYALHFRGTGRVDCGTLTELSGLNTYTVQFWLSLDQWNENASIYKMGEGATLFEAKLGAPGTVIFSIGGTSLNVQSEDIKVASWVHFSLINEGGKVRILVNNKPILSSNEAIDIPAVIDQSLLLGQNLNGRIDEFRLWNVAVADNFLLWQNTLNDFHPNYNQLVAYYKLDQNACTKMVDYTFKHHGTLIGEVTKEQVTDNANFKYKVVTAYTNFTRYFDRPNITRKNYLMANDIIILDLTAFPDGHARMNNPANEGVLTKANYLAEFEGRTGVVAFQGKDAKMDVGPYALNPEAELGMYPLSVGDYSFSTWLYLDEWTEGAFLVKKEASDAKGFSVRLGKEADHGLIIRLDGVEFALEGAKSTLKVGEWHHLGVITNSNSLKYPSEIFRFVLDGKGIYPTRYPETVEKDFKMTGVSEVSTILAENIKGKFDETVIWHSKRGVSNIKEEMTSGVRMPGIGNEIGEDHQFYCNSYWKYDKAENPGYDSYSYKEFVSIIRSAFEGRTGYTIRFGVRGQGNWMQMISNAARRTSLANDIAAIVESAGVDGIETDFEWAYSDYDNQNYSNLLEELKNKMPNKIVSSSPHAVCYGLKSNAIKAIDRFSFQVYTNRDLFTMESYIRAYNSFKNYGYPDSKIVMSYGATSSSGSNGSPENGYVSLIGYDPRPDVTSITNPAGISYNVCSFNQARERAQFVRDHDLAGLMYWDMGNDLPAANELSLCRAVNFALASNVDSLLTDQNLGVSIEQVTMDGNQGKQLSIYPNPAQDKVCVSLNSAEAISGFKVFDAKGLLIDEVAVPANVSSYIYTCTSLAKGTYVIQVTTSAKKQLADLLVVK